MRSRIRLLPFLCSCAFAFLAAGTASAGTKTPYPVTINWTTRTATGSMGSARAGSGGMYIGCWSAIIGLQDNTGGDATYQSGCWARQSSGTAISCTFPTVAAGPSAMPPIMLMTRDARISFSWDTNSICTNLQVWADSDTLPKSH